jgi:hypothetical protein
LSAITLLIDVNENADQVSPEKPGGDYILISFVQVYMRLISLPHFAIVNFNRFI